MPDIELLKRKAEKARVKLGLTPDQLQLMQHCAWGVYEDVSYDLEPDVKKSRLCRRATVLEVVADAGRLELALRARLNLPQWPRRGEKDEGEDHPVVKACRNSDLVFDLIGPAFHAQYYEAGPDPDGI